MKFFRLCLLSMTALLLVSPALRASTFDLSICSNITTAGKVCPNADSTKTQLTYTDGIIAYGYIIGTPGTLTDLYVKQGGTDENGLGINSEVDHEINTNELIDLDLSALFSSGIHNVTLNLQSLQTGEGYKICQSNVLGSLSGTCFTGSSVSATANVNVSLTSTTDILSITAFNADGLHPDADILVDSVTTPEPEVLTLFGSGLLWLGGLVFGRRKNLP
jgi:hypothetical protein